MQVAIKIRVKPKTRADRTIGVGSLRCLPAPDQPAHAISVNFRLDQGVAGKAAPCAEFGADARLVADNGQEIAGAAATQRVNQIGEQAGGKCLRAHNELDVWLPSHMPW